MKQFHIFHKWTKWSDPHIDQFGCEGQLLQTKVCTVCNKVKIARVPQPSLSRTIFNDVLVRIADLKQSS